MILRRVMEHVRTQNWLAVGIDFLIVVVGVFIGIQLGNWNESLSDDRRAESYIDRLTKEMEINRESVDGREKSYETQIEYGLFAMEAPLVVDDEDAAWAVIRAYFQASHAFTITLQRGTYDEIISAGDLALLDDQKLVNALSEVYTFAGFSTIDIIPPYRERVRRLVPLRLQQHMQAACYQITPPDIHRLVDCQPPENVAGLVALAAKLQSDEELVRDLRYMLSYADVSAAIARKLREQADAVLAILEDREDADRRLSQ